MLTRHTVTGGNAAQLGYYTEDESLSQADYYLEADGEGQSKAAASGQTVWLGKGAAAKGLEGAVEKQELEDIALGFTPGLGRTERLRGDVLKEKDKERLFHDFTWSFPKSLTLGAVVFGDNRLLQAMRETVAEMGDLLEERYAIARLQVDGVRREVKTGNLTMAAMEHFTSRPVTTEDEVAIDPQYHIHLLIMNSTLCPDGKNRALYSEKMSWVEGLDPIFKQKLALKLQALGYEIRETEHGFELASVSDQDIEVFSKRTNLAKERALSVGDELTPENIKHHAHATRQAKQIPLTLEELQEMWRIEAQENEVSKPVYGSSPVIPKGKGTVAEELEDAIAHLSERKVSFSKENIEQYVFSRTQQFPVEQLGVAIADHQQLIPLERDRFTTLDAVERETEIYQRWTAGEGRASPLTSTNLWALAGLSQEQRNAVVNTLESRDRHQLWQGFSGVGKTTALRTLKLELEAQGKVVRGFATTHEASRILSQELGITTHTVARLALATPETGSNQVWIIDEASLVDSKQMQAILQKADQVQARILMVGDKGQNSPVAAGSPFRFLQGVGATTHRLSEIKRQQDRSQRAAARLFAEGLGREGFELLESEGYIQEVSGTKTRASAIAKQYLALSTTERQETLIVSGTNQERMSITASLRTGMATEGSLEASVQAVQLVSKQYTRAQSKRIENYAVGDYLRLHTEYSTSPLKKDVLYKVEGIEGDQLILSSLGGRPYRLDPHKYTHKTVYRSAVIELAVGDRIRWTTTTKKKDRFNSQQLVITEMGETGFKAVDRQGREHSVSLMEPLAVDHDWVSTTYRAQGKTVKRAIVSATIDPTSSREPFYVGISRQTQNLSVYTQNLDELRDWVERSNVQTNAIDVLGVTHESGIIKVDADPARRADRADSATAAAEPAVSRGDDGAVRFPQSPDRGGNELDAADLAQRVKRLHRPVEGRASWRRREQDGGVDRAASQGDGRLQDRDARDQSRHDSSDGDRSGDEGRNIEGAGIRAGAAESQRSELDAYQESISDLAQTIKQFRQRRQLAASGLTSKIDEITSILKGEEPTPLEGIPELAQAIKQTAAKQGHRPGIA